MDAERVKRLLDEWRPDDRTDLARWCRDASQHIADESIKGGIEGYSEALFYTIRASDHAARLGNLPLARRIRPQQLLPVFTPDQAISLLGECERWAVEPPKSDAGKFTRDVHGFTDEELVSVREAVQSLGSNAKAAAIIKHVHIARPTGLAVLRYLRDVEKSYHGMARRHR